MADSPAAAVAPPLPGSQGGLEAEAEPKVMEPIIVAVTAGTDTSSDDGDEDGSQDAASVKTATADFFPDYEGDVPAERSSKHHKLGLDINEPWGWDGSSYNDYDVVTVHGIRDDYRTAWTDAKGAWWVKDQLFQNMSTREVDYCYEIDPASTLYEPGGIMQHARALISKYARLRDELEEDETDRPIIWICHDLGGTIVKEALYLAMIDPAQYGKIALVTTAIIFLGTPHRFQSTDDLEDQLCKLVLLPGPEIRDGILSKVKELARQVATVNQRFLATKIPDRAAVFNLFTRITPKNEEPNPVDANLAGVDGLGPKDTRDQDEGAADPATPFAQDAHFIGNSFEAAARFPRGDVDHLSLIRGERSGQWLSSLSNLFNVDGSPLRVKIRLLHFQTWLLSLAPPTRALDMRFDSASPYLQTTAWIYEQEPFIAFSKQGAGPRLLHLHANGNPLVDMSSVSRRFYHDFDGFWTSVGRGRRPEKSVVYFEFDQHDSRYNTISALLLYLLNALAWRFCEGSDQLMYEELEFLSGMHAWSPDDLLHLYSTLRSAGSGLTIFISCFDQCPADQRQWFLERVLEEQDYRDSNYRVILSTSARDDLLVDSFSDAARINLDDNPRLKDDLRNDSTLGLSNGLNALIAKRPIYEGFRPQLESLLEQCDSTPYLGRIILDWLGLHHRGKPSWAIAESISSLLPPTAENVVRGFIASLDSPALRRRAELAFNWVKHAAEPWSRKSLTQALTVYELGGNELGLSFEDLDVEGIMSEIEGALAGILTATPHAGDVKFSHASFYQVPEVGVEESGAEAVAKANSTIAETCLRYFQLGYPQETLAALSQAHLGAKVLPCSTEVDAAIIFHPRDSMATYAVRFWHHHYNASGRFKPRRLVDRLFDSNRARAAWEVPFWLLSSPFRRMQRTYVSTLPVFAMIGLEDLVLEKVQEERGHPTFHKDCWFAITEAARAGRTAMVQQLLGQVTAVDEEELGVALHWAAGRGDAALVNVLLDKIPNAGSFRWPDGMMHQAAAAGLDDLLMAMLLSGCDINETCEFHWRAPPAGVVAWRQRVSTMEFLLSSEYSPDLTVVDADGDTPLLYAAHRGLPRMIELLLRGSDAGTTDGTGKGPVYRAAEMCNHKAIDLLIEAGADFTIGGEQERYPDLRSPLVIAAELGSQECVRVLLAHGADPNAEIDVTTSLYQAVLGGHHNVARQLLTHEPKPDMDKTPPDMVRLLMRAVATGNTELVSLLIDHGAEVDFVDPNEFGFSKTPLSLACGQGHLEVVKLLLEKGADINFTGGESDSPLLTAFYDGRIEVAKHLLQDDTVDITQPAPDGTTPLHASCSTPSLVSELLRRGAPVDGHSTSWGTVLHSAVRKDSPEAIQLLLAHDPMPEIDAVYGEDGWNEDQIGLTPLQLACRFQSPKCVKSLLEGGASPTFKNKDGDDAVDILLRAESDPKAAVECLRLLISVPDSIPGDQTDEHGRSRLHAIQPATPVSVVQALVEAKAPIDLRDEDGHSPLSVAVSNGNDMVARYLVKQGASVNRSSPVFGTILHLAVRRGDVSLAKFLVDSGADLETVDPKSGESLLYTALDIEDQAKLKAMVRYLVDDAKVPIDQPGGAPFRYPIIRAAYMARHPYLYSGMHILKFLIRRNAQLEVSDGQGRRAVHIASASWLDEGIKALVGAGAKLDVKDALGRLPIHFAAAQPQFNLRCFDYLMDACRGALVNEPDLDKWTPLMWAARSSSPLTVHKLLEANADVWARGWGVDEREEWSALKLLNFSGHRAWDPFPSLEPQERTKVGPDGEMEEWDDAFHKTDVGDWKRTRCSSCFVSILGIEWKCGACNDDFSLCFKCYRHRLTLHKPEHEFIPIEPRYRQSTPSPVFFEESDDRDDGDDEQESPHPTFGDQDTGAIAAGEDAAGSPREGSSEQSVDFDMDGSDEE